MRTYELSVEEVVRDLDPRARQVLDELADGHPERFGRVIASMVEEGLAEAARAEGDPLPRIALSEDETTLTIEAFPAISPEAH